MNNEDKKNRMRELVTLLNRARRAYEQEDVEIMSNLEYDRLYDELEALEKEMGVILSGSPTISVGYEAVSNLPKEAHPSPMLSLDKTKDPAVLAQFVGEKTGVLSWKLDGLTIVLTYENGQLVKAVTRGNGQVGEVVTNNARVFANLPLRISYKGRLVLRGEAVIRYEDFDRINEEMADQEAKYKNPRNLCSGSVRQLNNEVTAKRHVHFYAFALVDATGEEVDFHNSRSFQLDWLQNQGFETVQYKLVTQEDMEEVVRWFADHIRQNPVPSDGLVLLFDDIAYGVSLGHTAKFPRDSIAFKWSDEQAETVLRQIEWSPSRTGLLNPVAVFDPVELEGTTVGRASVHNLNILEELRLAPGDHILVYKANMIIPQIAENLTGSGPCAPPESCPVCGADTQVVTEAATKMLYCPNPACQAKHIKSLTHFVNRNAMDIEGLSEATLKKMLTAGLIKEPADIFRLSAHKETICQMEGWGEKSAANLLANIERARRTTADRLIYSLGIPGIGLATAKLICRQSGEDLDLAIHLSEEELAGMDGIGPVLAHTYVSYFADPVNRMRLAHLREQLHIEERQNPPAKEQTLAGQTYVITGSLVHFTNRTQLKELLESRGAKVTGSVTKKTTALINNDTASASSKNKKAKELQVPVLSEEALLARLGLQEQYKI